MSIITSQLITEIEEKINPELKEYFERTKDVYDYGYSNITDLIRNIMEENAMGDDDSDYKETYAKEVTARRSRRNNWLKKMKENNSKVPYRMSNSYFHHIHQQFASAEGSRFLQDKYKTTSIHAIVSTIIEETEKWKSSGNGFLVQCPNFPHVGNVNIPAIYESDLFCDICNIINTYYDGNLKNALFSTSWDMILNPVFSSMRGKAEVKLSADEKAIAEIFSDEHYTLMFSDVPETAGEEFKQSGKIKIPLFDDIDMSIISFLINNAKIDLTSPSSVLAPRQTTTLRAICNYVYAGKTPSSQQRESVRKHLIRLSYPIQAKGDKGTIFSSAILSDVLLQKDPESKENASLVVYYTLGNMLTRELVQNRILKFPTQKMDNLKPSGKTLLLQMQLDRIARAFSGACTARYTYSRMVQIMLLRNRSMKKNMAIITEALDDVKINMDGKVVKDYQIRGSEIIVEFCPMSQAEQLEIINNNDIKSISEDRSFE